MIDKILLAYDGSDNARRALDIAAELCVKCDVALSIVHVLMHGRPAEELVRMANAEHLVKEAHKTVTPGVSFAAGRSFDLLSPDNEVAGAARVISAVGDQLLAFAKASAKELGVKAVHIEARNGDYADEILDAAREQNADMIVLGSRGLGIVRGTVLGSVSQKVLHHATQAVLAVK